MQDSGEGRWTILAAIEEAVPAEVLSASLYARFRSRQEHTFADKMLSGMRKKFGGHMELEAAGEELKRVAVITTMLRVASFDSRSKRCGGLGRSQ